MSGRRAHLVGSMPGATAREAMRQAVDLLGPHLASLPDGETGARRNWVIPVIESLRTHPDLEVKKEGDWSDYDRLVEFRIRKGHRLYGASMDFGHVAAALDSYPVFQEVVGAAGLSDVVFQQGVPSDLDMALFVLGRAAGPRHKRAFTEATIAEVRAVAAVTAAGTLFQLETPLELALLAKAPPAARAGLAKVFARSITGVVAGAAPGTHFAVHLCMGDMNNRSIDRMKDADPLVRLATELIRQWPEGRPLELIHAPFATGDVPAPTDPAFYAPLASLNLPSGVRFAAGFAHESQSLADQRGIRSMIDDRLGRTVEISAACGLGRRSFEAGRAVLERHAELCRD